jgi:hypothetical protein
MCRAWAGCSGSLLGVLGRTEAGPVAATVPGPAACAWPGRAVHDRTERRDTRRVPKGGDITRQPRPKTRMITTSQAGR